MRKICIVTGSRAEYGILRPLIKTIRDEDDLILQIIATGAHLSARFGMTYREIEEDGFLIDEKVDIGLKGDAPRAIAGAMGAAIGGLAGAYLKLDPDIVVLLGDRFEIFSAAAAALVTRTALAHIHGGEVTMGAYDDAFRHAITKMSHLHFVATKEYRDRVIQLGEDRRNVHNVGALGLESMRNTVFFSRKEMEKELGLVPGRRSLLVTFHPETLGDEDSAVLFGEIIKALDGKKGVKLIFTGSNADTGGNLINKMINKYVSANPGRAVAFKSLGQRRYFSALRYVDAVVGNSSSGVIEAPSFGIPTVNVGDRQKGRIKAKSVIDCRTDAVSISKAIDKAFSDSFRKICRCVVNPYDGGDNVSGKIVKALKDFDLNKDFLKKEFRDIGADRRSLGK